MKYTTDIWKVYKINRNRGNRRVFIFQSNNYNFDKGNVKLKFTGIINILVWLTNAFKKINLLKLTLKSFVTFFLQAGFRLNKVNVQINNT